MAETIFGFVYAMLIVGMYFAAKGMLEGETHVKIKFFKDDASWVCMFAALGMTSALIGVLRFIGFGAELIVKMFAR